jgi:two-component system alkaline phosphatase synthesis response regulator PhoP
MARHLLMIEDDTFITQMYSTKLEGKGFEIDVAPSGEKGLELARENAKDLDLILLDIVLPGQSGIEVLETLMKNEQLQRIPVVMLSNLASQKDVDTCLELGAKDYIVKSNYTPDEISSLVQKYL